MPKQTHTHTLDNMFDSKFVQSRWCIIQNSILSWDNNVNPYLYKHGFPSRNYVYLTVILITTLIFSLCTVT